MKTTTRLIAALTLMGVALPYAQQDDEPKEGQGLREAIDAAERSPQDEMQELFRQVETRLQTMGGYMLDAGAGDTRKLAELGEAGIEDLLRGSKVPPQSSGGVADLLKMSQAEGERVSEGIQRILELAEQNGGS